MKRFAVTILALCLCLCVSGASAFTMTGLETETVSREWETNLFFARMAELTGVEVSASAEYETEKYDKLLKEMENGVVTTDALFKANLTREQEIALYESGAIIDLAPMIQAHMPNLSALLEKNPQWRDEITLDGGQIVSLPQINTQERMICVWINRAWLDKLNLAMPTNMQELTDVLLAFKDGDPNGNYKQDEIAADLLGVYEMRWLLPYFSVIADDYHLARGADGEYVFAPEMEGYREFVKTLAKWNELGILDEDAFTGIHSSIVLEDTSDKELVSGMIVTLAPYTNVPAAYAQQYVPLLMAGPDGSIRWRDALGEVWTGCFAVTSACEDPAQALIWADALYSEEGAILAYAGEEGVEYEFGEDGKWVFITDTMQTIERIRGNSIIYTGVTMPGISPADFLASVNSEIDMHILACTQEVRAVSEQVSPAYLLSEEAQARATDIMASLGRAVDEGIGRFASGEVEITDETWNEWLRTLREAGSEELTALFNAAVK